MRVPTIGEEFAGYRIETVLGRGGMGVVYRAEHLELERKVALKLLAETLSEDDSFRKRFIRESKLAASLDHPNVIPIYGAGEQDGLLYIAMRYVDGSDLKQLIKQQGALDPALSLVLLEQAASALDAAHARGLVHRDVKPHNMLIASSPGLAGGHVYLSDFGLAKSVTSRTEITATGTFMGTIDYVAPEQIEGQAADALSDVYSLGCVFFECLTGSIPFTGDTDMAVAHGHIGTAPPEPSRLNQNLPRGLDAVTARAMAKAPGDRYKSCNELVSAARTVFEAAGHDLHAEVGSGGRAATGAKTAETMPPAASPLGSVDPVGSAATQSFGTVASGDPMETMGTMVPPVLQPNSPIAPLAPTPSPYPVALPQPPGPRGKQKKKRTGLWLVLALLLLAALAIPAYLLFFQDEDPVEEPITFLPRATSKFPDELATTVGGFRLIAPRLDKPEAEPGFTAKLAGLYKNGEDEQVFHTVVDYPKAEQAESQRQTAVNFLISKGFSIVEEGATKRAFGGPAGNITLLRQSKEGVELEALAWTNDTLAVVARGPEGATFDFYSEIPY